MKRRTFLKRLLCVVGAVAAGRAIGSTPNVAPGTIETVTSGNIKALPLGLPWPHKELISWMEKGQEEVRRNTSIIKGFPSNITYDLASGPDTTVFAQVHLGQAKENLDKPKCTSITPLPDYIYLDDVRGVLDMPEFKPVAGYCSSRGFISAKHLNETWN